VPSRHSVVPEAIRQVVAQVIGNDAAVAFAENHSIREVMVARGHIDSGKLTERQLDDALDVLAMTHPQ
jgi:fumarate hydratase class II